jgi:hypothetical protein
MITSHSTRQKSRTIVMLTSSMHIGALHFAAFRPNSLPNHRKNAVFLMQSSQLVRALVKACMVMRFQKDENFGKVDFFFKHFFSKSKNGQPFHVLFQKKR